MARYSWPSAPKAIAPPAWLGNCWQSSHRSSFRAWSWFVAGSMVRRSSRPLATHPSVVDPGPPGVVGQVSPQRCGSSPMAPPHTENTYR